MLDLVGLHFRICGILIDPGHPGDVFDVGYMPFERSLEAAISRGAAAKVSCDCVNVNKPKFRNFDRPLGLPGQDVGNVSSLRNMTVRVRGNCRCRQPRNNSRDRADINRRKSRRYKRYLQNFDGPLGLSGRRRQCFWRRQRVISSKNEYLVPGVRNKKFIWCQVTKCKKCIWCKMTVTNNFSWQSKG